MHFAAIFIIIGIVAAKKSAECGLRGENSFGRIKNVLALACPDLSRLYQSGAARFPARRELARHARRTGRSRLLYGDRDHGHFGRDHPFQPAFGQADKKIRRAHRDGGQRLSDRGGAVRIFLCEQILDAHSLCRPLRAGRGRHRRGAEQLCGAALQIQAHELAALLLGRGDDHQPLCHELRPRLLRVEQRLPHCGIWWRPPP